MHARIGQQALLAGVVVGRAVGEARLRGRDALGGGEGGGRPRVDVGVDVDGGDGAVDGGEGAQNGERDAVVAAEGDDLGVGFTGLQ